MADTQTTATAAPSQAAPKPGFIETARVRTKLPTELPNALEAQKEGRPAGAAYQLADGTVYRLVHAGWRKDVPRKPAAKK